MPNKRIMAHKWSTTKYNENMPEKLLKNFSEGRGVEYFCAQNNISNITFNSWITHYPMFKLAYQIGLPKSKKWWMDLARAHIIEEQDGPRLNTKLWKMIMQNQHDLASSRRVEVDGLAEAKTTMEQINIIIKEIGSGTITANEASMLSKVIESAVKIDEHTELSKRIDAIEQAAETGANDAEFVEE